MNIRSYVAMYTNQKSGQRLANHTGLQLQLCANLFGHIDLNQGSHR